VFIGNWNELLVALVFVSSEQFKTLPVGLTTFVGVYSTDYTPMLAALVIAIAPTIIIYSIFNKKIIGGMTVGSIKG
jgi:raffinose/stachyose/melibiose transport system permease protein